MQFRTRVASGVLIGLAAVGGISACGSSGSSGTSTGGSSSNAPNAAPSPVANIPHLTGVHTQVILDSGFVNALTSLHVMPGTVGSASLSGGTLTFPITGGNVIYYKPGSVNPYVQGKIYHVGSGLSLSAGGTTVELTNFIVDPGASMLYGKVAANGKTVLPKAPLFFLNGSTLQPLSVDKAAGAASLYGTKVYLTSAAAQLLNKTFKVNALSSQTLIGVAKITVKLP